MVRVDERKAAMRAIQIARLDGPQAAEVVEIDEPSGDGLVLIDVHAAGVAFPDALQSRGLYQYKPEMPYTPGSEVAGVVRSAPDGAHVKAGDRVAALTMLCGAMAEVVALQPDRVFKLPDTVSFEAGAGLLFNDLTVHYTLRTRGRLAEGETVLVHGAAGGIGTSTVRLGCRAGRRLQGRRQGVDRRARRGHRGRSSRRRPVHRLAALPGAWRPASGHRLHRRRHPDRQGQPVAAEQRRCRRRRLGSLDADSPRLSGRAVGRVGAAAGVGHGVGARADRLPPGARRRGDRLTGGPDGQGQGRREIALSVPVLWRLTSTKSGVAPASRSPRRAVRQPDSLSAQRLVLSR